MKKSVFKLLVLLSSFGLANFSEAGKNLENTSSEDYGESFQDETVYLEWLLNADSKIEAIRTRFEKILLNKGYIVFMSKYPEGYEMQAPKGPYAEIKESFQDTGEKITRFKHQLYETIEIYTTCKSILKKTSKNFALEHSYQYILISEFSEDDYPQICKSFAKEFTLLRSSFLSELNTSIKFMAKENEDLGQKYRFNPIKGEMKELKEIAYELGKTLQIALSP